MSSRHDADIFIHCWWSWRKGLSVCPLVHPSICLFTTLVWFLHISGQTTDGIALKHLVEAVIMVIPRTFHHALLNSCCSLTPDWAISAHLRANCWSDGAQIWWANSLQASASLIHFQWCSAKLPPLPGLQFVEQFRHICIQITDQILVGQPIMILPRPD